MKGTDMTKKTKSFQVRVTEKTWKKVKEITNKNNETPSEYIEKIIQNALK